MNTFGERLEMDRDSIAAENASRAPSTDAIAPMTGDNGESKTSRSVEAVDASITTDASAAAIGTKRVRFRRKMDM